MARDGPRLVADDVYMRRVRPEWLLCRNGRVFDALTEIRRDALAFTADRVMEKHAPARGTRASRQRMYDELQLTPQQQASVDSLIEQKHRQIIALYKPVKPQLDSLALQARVVSDSTHAQIKRLLNSDQQAKLDKMRAAARKDLAERRGGDSAERPPGPRY